MLEISETLVNSRGYWKRMSFGTSLNVRNCSEAKSETIDVCWCERLTPPTGILQVNLIDHITQGKIMILLLHGSRLLFARMHTVLPNFGVITRGQKNLCWILGLFVHAGGGQRSDWRGEQNRGKPHVAHPPLPFSFWIVRGKKQVF